MSRWIVIVCLVIGTLPSTASGQVLGLMRWGMAANHTYRTDQRGLQSSPQRRFGRMASVRNRISYRSRSVSARIKVYTTPIFVHETRESK